MKKLQNERIKKRQSGGSHNKDKITKKVDRTKEIEEQLRIQRAAATAEANKASVPVVSALKGYKYDEKTDRYYKEDKSQTQPVQPIQRKNHEKDNLLSFLRRREEGTRYFSGHYELLSIAHFVTLGECS